MNDEGQLDLLDPPISRRHDPDTSKDAEDKQNLGPRAVRQREVLGLVGRNPRKTAGELARIYVHENPRISIKVAAETPHKRISDLMHKGLVERAGKRECHDSGYDAYVYVLTDAGKRELEVRF